jgi:signal transduction histidine kinase
LLPTYLSYDRKIVRIAERLLGVKRENFSIPVDTVEVYRHVVRDRQTILAKDVKKILRQLLPESLKRFAGRTVRILKVPQSIFAPLVIEEEVIGIFSVQADDLTEEDMPAMTVFAHQIAAAWRKVTLLQNLEESLAELESTQDQLLQAQKMEAIGQLAGGIAHDFNNLLTAINGFAGLMQLSLSTDDPLWEMTEKILDSGQRAAGLIRQLLAFSRKQIIEPQVLILNSVVTDMEKMLRRLIGEDIQLETSLSLELWPVKVDPTQMGQIIVNLALNARDAMPTGGRLTIETANVTLDEAYAAGHLEAQPGEYVRLAVSDTGHGIKKEVQSRIFEPFFTTKEAGQGSGLGLATVYGIVKQSSGDIQVYSEVNQGTTFKIYLPRTPEAVRPAPQPAEEQELPSGHETVLLVEDDEFVRSLSRRVLESRGYSVLEARRGVEALRLAAGYAGPIHLLLTDVVMPDMGGKALAEQITATRPEMKVVYMSGYTDNAIARHGVLEPGLPFLQKPFSPKQLARKVRAVLDN